MKRATESAMKPKSSAPVPVLAASGMENFMLFTGPTLPSPSSVRRSTRKFVPPRSSA